MSVFGNVTSSSCTRLIFINISKAKAAEMIIPTGVLMRDIEIDCYHDHIVTAIK